MAHRPTRRKAANRLRKMLRNTPEASIDLVAYLKDRRYARTTGEAEAMILARRVVSESHPLGIRKAKVPKESAALKVVLGRPLVEDDLEEREVVDRLVPARLRRSIQVLSA